MGLTNVVFFGLLVLLIIERLLELRISKRNTAKLLAAGGFEADAGHYAVIVAMHVLFFVSLVVEFLLRQPLLPIWWWLPLIGFMAGQATRYWSRRALGARFTTRVIIIRNEPLVTQGPYKFFRHPIYVAVALELAAFPMIFGLWITALVFSILNLIVLRTIRIPSEEKALGLS